MSSRKQLKYVNPVSKKSGEGHFDPFRPVASVSLVEAKHCEICGLVRSDKLATGMPTDYLMRSALGRESITARPGHFFG
jgi:hypothetical protein